MLADYIACVRKFYPGTQVNLMAHSMGGLVAGLPAGTANVNFHGFSGPQGAQDDWRTDTTGVKYFHIVGAGGAPDTINQVVATTTVKCLYYGGTDCDISTGEYPKYAIGDQTVPLLSSSRNGGVNGNYNAPGATVYTCQAAGKNSANVSHISMLSNPVVQGLLLQYLAQANGATPVPPPSPATCGNGVSATPGPTGPHQLTIDGATELRVSDATTPTNTLPFLRGVTQHRVNPTATQLLMAGGEYTVTFKTQPEPAMIEWLYGPDMGPTHAVRFLGVQLPSNRQAQIVVRDGAFGGLRYDSDGDGAVDFAVSPTFAPVSPAAQDVMPPDVNVSSATLGNGSGVQVTINALDGGAGVERLLYSFDGKVFTPYVGPFVVDPRQVRTIYAFADDKVGNRSSLCTHRLPDLKNFFPIIAR